MMSSKSGEEFEMVYPFDQSDNTTPNNPGDNTSPFFRQMQPYFKPYQNQPNPTGNKWMGLSNMFGNATNPLMARMQNQMMQRALQGGPGTGRPTAGWQPAPFMGSSNTWQGPPTTGQGPAPTGGMPTPPPASLGSPGNNTLTNPPPQMGGGGSPVPYMGMPGPGMGMPGPTNSGSGPLGINSQGGRPDNILGNQTLPASWSQPPSAPPAEGSSNFLSDFNSHLFGGRGIDPTKMLADSTNGLFSGGMFGAA